MSDDFLKEDRSYKYIHIPRTVLDMSSDEKI